MITNRDFNNDDIKHGDIFISNIDDGRFILGNKYKVLHIDYDDYEPIVYFDDYNLCGWWYVIDNFSSISDLRDAKINSITSQL